MLLKVFCSLVIGLALSLSEATTAIGAEHFEATVVGIADGDTISVLHDGKERKIRLSGIDCPEKGQPFGTKARECTSGLAFGKTVQVDVQSFDRYGRTVGEVTLPDGRNLSNVILEQGYAWWYKKYSRDLYRQGLEQDARSTGRELWSEPSPRAPWEFRAEKRSGKSLLSNWFTRPTKTTRRAKKR